MAIAGLELPAPEVMERAFERDLAWLADALQADVVSAEPVSPLRALGHPRTAFRVTLSDGRQVKLRRMSEVDEATTLEHLLAALAPIGFPQVLARRARSLVIEWVPGEDFSARPETTDRIEAAGRLLGQIHATRSFAGQPLPVARPSAAELARSEAQLSQLVAAKGLCGDEAVRLADATSRLVPPRSSHGIVHGDFSPENLVVHPSGALRIVDNEVLRVGALDLDLARVWSRWPMGAEAWRAFLSAYAEASGRSCDERDLRGWKLRALVLSAWYRTAFGIRGADVAISRLRDFGASVA